MDKYKFDCGCEFDIVGQHPSNPKYPLIDWDIINTPYTCKGTWDLIASGKTKGVFQLESHLGQTWAKKVAPVNMEHLSALGAILRPGCMNSKIDDKSLTQHYADRKNNLEVVPEYHPVVDKILEPTYGILTYQEQAMRMCVEVAKFNEQEADALRKAIGKKIAQEMAAVKRMFFEKSKECNIVNKEQAKEIFGWIESSQRYSFNKCVSGDTLVKTINGYDTVKNVKIGEYIKAPSANFYVKVINKFDNGVKDCLEITTDKYKSIVCTSDHKFLCDDGVVRPLSDVIKNHKIVSIDGHEEIIMVEAVGHCKTYDIEVDSKEHLYYGNGLAISNSHSVSYGIMGYWCAYAKYHFTKLFFTSWLRNAYADTKPREEVSALVHDAKNFNIDVKCPDFRDRQNNFYIKDGLIKVGLNNIKGVGESVIEKIDTNTKTIELLSGKQREQWNWMDILLLFSSHITSPAFLALINSGAFDYLGIARVKMAYEFDKWQQLDNEKDWFLNEYLNRRWTSLRQAIVDGTAMKKDGGAAKSKKGLEKLQNLVKSLDNPPIELADVPDKLATLEEQLIGCSISFHRIASCDIGDANCTCADFLAGKESYTLAIAAEVSDVRLNKIKTGDNKGKEMAFVKISDESAMMDATVFSEAYGKYGNLLCVGNTVLFKGYRGRDSGFIVKEMYQI